MESCSNTGVKKQNKAKRKAENKLDVGIEETFKREGGSDLLPLGDDSRSKEEALVFVSDPTKKSREEEWRKEQGTMGSEE
ncbi:unnamed protein product [Citrullus colocynthis]|uniref:Uncharacterized protein n=1 Tax=Citrullus colocynthis TaxID=252529 RepID=A0ABP0YI34_9ROSI